MRFSALLGTSRRSAVIFAFWDALDLFICLVFLLGMSFLLFSMLIFKNLTLLFRLTGGPTWKLMKTLFEDPKRQETLLLDVVALYR